MKHKKIFVTQGEGKGFLAPVLTYNLYKEKKNQETELHQIKQLANHIK